MMFPAQKALPSFLSIPFKNHSLGEVPPSSDGWSYLLFFWGPPRLCLPFDYSMYQVARSILSPSLDLSFSHPCCFFLRTIHSFYSEHFGFPVGNCLPHSRSCVLGWVPEIIPEVASEMGHVRYPIHTLNVSPGPCLMVTE